LWVANLTDKTYNQLLPEWVDQKVNIYRAISVDVTYTYFNFNDPVVGGFSKDKIALRRAVIMGFNEEELIRVVRKNQAIHAEMPIPPGAIGHDPKYRSINYYDPDLANKLLDRFGYKKGADGYRTFPDGKPLTLKLATGSSAVEREQSELWRKSMDAIGLRMEFQISKFSDNLKAARACQLMMWGAGWTADYPDGDNFMQLLYGGNVGQSNVACYRSPTYDKLYEESRLMPDSPNRNRLFEQMTRQFETDAPWRLGTAVYQNTLVQPRVIGYKAHPVLLADWMYVDIDASRH